MKYNKWIMNIASILLFIGSFVIGLLLYFLIEPESFMGSLGMLVLWMIMVRVAYEVIMKLLKGIFE